MSDRPNISPERLERLGPSVEEVRQQLRKFEIEFLIKDLVSLIMTDYDSEYQQGKSAALDRVRYGQCVDSIVRYVAESLDSQGAQFGDSFLAENGWFVDQIKGMVEEAYSLSRVFSENSNLMDDISKATSVEVITMKDGYVIHRKAYQFFSLSLRDLLNKFYHWKPSSNSLIRWKLLGGRLFGSFEWNPLGELVDSFGVIDTTEPLDTTFGVIPGMETFSQETLRNFLKIGDDLAEVLFLDPMRFAVWWQKLIALGIFGLSENVLDGYFQKIAAKAFPKREERDFGIFLNKLKCGSMALFLYFIYSFVSPTAGSLFRATENVRNQFAQEEVREYLSRDDELSRLQATKEQREKAFEGAQQRIAALEKKIMDYMEKARKGQEDLAIEGGYRVTNTSRAIFREKSAAELRDKLTELEESIAEAQEALDNHPKYAELNKFIDKFGPTDGAIMYLFENDPGFADLKREVMEKHGLSSLSFATDATKVGKLKLENDFIQQLSFMERFLRSAIPFTPDGKLAVTDFYDQAFRNFFLNVFFKNIISYVLRMHDGYTRVRENGKINAMVGGILEKGVFFKTFINFLEVRLRTEGRDPSQIQKILQQLSSPESLRLIVAAHVANNSILTGRPQVLSWTEGFLKTGPRQKAEIDRAARDIHAKAVFLNKFLRSINDLIGELNESSEERIATPSWGGVNWRGAIYKKLVSLAKFLTDQDANLGMTGNSGLTTYAAMIEARLVEPGQRTIKTTDAQHLVKTVMYGVLSSVLHTIPDKYEELFRRELGYFAPFSKLEYLEGCDLEAHSVGGVYLENIALLVVPSNSGSNNGNGNTNTNTNTNPASPVPPPPNPTLNTIQPTNHHNLGHNRQTTASNGNSGHNGGGTNPLTLTQDQNKLENLLQTQVPVEVTNSPAANQPAPAPTLSAQSQYERLQAQVKYIQPELDELILEINNLPGDWHTYEENVKRVGEIADRYQEIRPTVNEHGENDPSKNPNLGTNNRLNILKNKLEIRKQEIDQFLYIKNKATQI